jgi:integrase
VRGTLVAVPPRASGEIKTHPWADGRTVSYSLRVRAHGTRHQLKLGTNHQGWNEHRAQVELDGVLQRIARGTWTPPEPKTALTTEKSPEEETLHVTVSRWWHRRDGEQLAPKTRKDYRWRIDHILLDLDLAHTPTSNIDVRRVDDFRLALVGRGLGPRAVNMVLGLLAQILDDAVDYKLLDANPARGKRRRMKVPKPPRSFLEPDMVVDMLDAAGDWEAELLEHQRYGRRALLALLLLSGGPRVNEVILADRGELDIHAGRWRIPEAKTPAGERDIELTAFTLDELRAHLARRPLPARSPLFPTRPGGRLNDSNMRNRLLNGEPAKPATDTQPSRKPIKGLVQRVNEKRAAEGRMLLPKRVTPHTLRRTWAMLALTAGRDVRWVMAQMGHDDPSLTLQVYAQAIQRQRVDYELVWKLMRFTDEEDTWTGPRRGSLAQRNGLMEPRDDRETTRKAAR